MIQKCVQRNAGLEHDVHQPSAMKELFDGFNETTGAIKGS